MARIGKQAFGAGTLPELKRKLRGNPAAFFRTRDEVETAARKALARAQAAEPRFLGRLPRTPCVVKRIDEFEEKDAPIAYYRPAAIDGTRPGTYYVNTYKPKTRARYEVEALAFHESVPGHHVQIAIAQELTGLPEFPQARRASPRSSKGGACTRRGSPTSSGCTRARASAWAG